MRLKSLFEEPDIINKELAKQIIKDCEPYLTEIHHDVDSYRLFRGLQMESFARRNSEIARNVFKATVRKDRVPLSTPKVFHEFIDSWMEKNLGKKFRSESIFCASNRITVLNYGKPYVIMPIGKFSYAWSPFIEDLYSDVEELNFSLANKDSKEVDKVKDKLKEILDGAFYKTTELVRMMTEFKSHEIMIHCDEYYAFEQNTYDNYFCPLYDLIAK